MATLQCTLKYEGDKLTKTYQVLFDEKDTIKILTETPSLAIKGGNARARKLMPTVQKGGGRSARAVKSSPNEYDPPLVAGGKMSAKAAKVGGAAKQAQFCFSAPAGKMARFICGIRLNGKFQAYPEGLEVPTPP